MKKLISLVLVVLMAGMLLVPVAAVNKPVNTNLKNLETLPTTEMISLGLTASEAYSEDAWAADSLTDDQIKDIADLKYGVSMIGVTGLERPLTGLVDGVYTSGNTGAALLNGKKASGAGSWYCKLGTYYNVKGETGAADSIYYSLLTYNFGKKMNIDAIAFSTSSSDHIPVVVS